MIEPEVKPVKGGYKTSEFYVAILAVIGAMILCGLGKISSDVLMVVLGGASGAYSLSRGLAKR